MARKMARGITLLELMIALAVASMSATAIYGVFISQQKVYTVQQEVSDAQHNARNSLSAMVDVMRQTGFALPRTFAFQGSGVNDNVAPCGSDTITFQVRNAIGGFAVTDIPNETSLVVDAADAAAVNAVWVYDNSLSFVDVPAFLYGRSDRMTFIESATLPVNGGTAVTLSGAAPGIADGVFMGPRAYVAAVDRHSYYLDFCDTAHPALMYRFNNEAPVPYASNIEDLQFAFFVDEVRNGTAIAAPDGLADDFNSPVHANISDARLQQVKAVRVSLIARTETEDLDLSLGDAARTEHRPALENHATNPDADAYKRRIFSALVLLPNVFTDQPYTQFPNEF